jgi:hypothetical protein
MLSPPSEFRLSWLCFCAKLYRYTFLFNLAKVIGVVIGGWMTKRLVFAGAVAEHLRAPGIGCAGGSAVVPGIAVGLHTGGEGSKSRGSGRLAAQRWLKAMRPVLPAPRSMPGSPLSQPLIPGPLSPLPS